MVNKNDVNAYIHKMSLVELYLKGSLTHCKEVKTKHDQNHNYSSMIVETDVIKFDYTVPYVGETFFETDIDKLLFKSHLSQQNHGVELETIIKNCNRINELAVFLKRRMGITIHASGQGSAAYADIGHRLYMSLNIESADIKIIQRMVEGHVLLMEFPTEVDVVVGKYNMFYDTALIEKFILKTKNSAQNFMTRIDSVYTQAVKELSKEIAGIINEYRV